MNKKVYLQNQNGFQATLNGHGKPGANGQAAELLPPAHTARKHYDRDFTVTPAYKASLPDLQNGPISLIQGSPVSIQQVGIHNFRLPLAFVNKAGERLTLETSITGTVSLDAHKKGINMSRVMRTFYEYRDRIFDLDVLEEVLQAYRDNLESLDARLTLRFRYPIENGSLRSGLSGFQYYDVALEARQNRAGEVDKLMHLDFVYSSACPCSTR